MFGICRGILKGWILTFSFFFSKSIITSEFHIPNCVDYFLNVQPKIRNCVKSRHFPRNFIIGWSWYKLVPIANETFIKITFLQTKRRFWNYFNWNCCWLNSPNHVWGLEKYYCYYYSLKEKPVFYRSVSSYGFLVQRFGLLVDHFE